MNVYFYKHNPLSSRHAFIAYAVPFIRLPEFTKSNTPPTCTLFGDAIYPSAHGPKHGPLVIRLSPLLRLFNVKV